MDKNSDKNNQIFRDDWALVTLDCYKANEMERSEKVTKN